MAIDGGIAKDTDQMANYGLADLIKVGFDTYRDKKEHEQEMERLDKITQIEYIKQPKEVENTSVTEKLSQVSRETYIGLGVIIVSGVVLYRSFS